MTDRAPDRPTGFWVRLIVYPLFWAGWIYVIRLVLPWQQTNAGRDLSAYLTLGLAVLLLPPILYLLRPPWDGLGYVAEFLLLNFLLIPLPLVLPFSRLDRLWGLFVVFFIILPSVVGWALGYLVNRFLRKVARGCEAWQAPASGGRPGCCWLTPSGNGRRRA